MWLYGSGFPKSLNIGLALDKKNGVDSKVVGQNSDILKKQAKDLREGHRKIVDSFNAGADERNNGFVNVSADIKEPVSDEGKQWKGWGTCLKPSFEPIIVARKPFSGSLIDNVVEYGVGGINIDECRVGDEVHKVNINDFSNQHGNQFGNRQEIPKLGEKEVEGRFPSNTILTYDETDFDEVCGGFPKDNKNNSNARYFYCAKASAKDRDEGLDRFEEKEVRILNATNPELEKKDDVFSRFITVNKNTHPTVKPTELMQYLVRLVTPRGGTILDPFNGSGSTGKAVAFENRERNANYKYIGIELDKYYCDISKARIQWASVEYVYTDDENVTEELVSDLKSNINKSKGIRLW